MSYSLTKIWIHAIWSTKDRRPLISTKIEPLLHEYMKSQFKSIGCSVEIINGMPDHVHCFFLLNREKSIADVIKQVKGSTSHFVNSSKLIEDKFAWQTGYAAFSVSESGVAILTEYIKNQKIHHSKNTFNEEFEGLLGLHNLSQENRFIRSKSFG